MTLKEHDQRALAVNMAIGQSVAQSLYMSGNKTVQAGSTSQQKPRLVTISPLLVRDPHTSRPITLKPAAINIRLYKPLLRLNRQVLSHCSPNSGLYLLESQSRQNHLLQTQLVSQLT